MLQVVNQDQLTINNKSKNEKEREGQDKLGLIPLPPRCFPSLSFSFPKHSKYLKFLFKKFRDTIPNPPKGSHLLRGFFTKYFIPKSSFQTCLVARIQPYHLPKLNENKFSSPIHSPTNERKLTLLFARLLNLWTNSFAPGEHDENQKYMKMTKDVVLKGHLNNQRKTSSQGGIDKG